MNQVETILTDANVNLQLRGEREVPWLDDPPLGHMQAVVLRKLYDLEDEAYGLKVVQTLSAQSGVLVDHSQIYTAIRKLKKDGLIKIKEVRKQEGKRPALKIYELSASGIAALHATTDHHRAVAAFLSEGTTRAGE